MTRAGWLAVAMLAAAASTWVLTRLIERFARARAILDIPNERSSHQMPTPRGGGVAIAAVVITGVILLAAWHLLEAQIAIGIAGGGLAVATIGWYDDRRGASPLARLIVHIAAATWAMYWLGGLPALDLGFTRITLGPVGMFVGGFIVVLCINLYNFMDGIDGIAAGEAVSVGVVGGLLLTSTGTAGLGSFLLLVAASAAGF